MKRWLLMLGAVLALVLVIGGIKAWNIKKMMDGYAAMGEPKATVSTVKAAYTEWSPSLTAVGTLRAVRGIEVAPEVAGRVDSVNFTSGDEAGSGDVLVELVSDADQARLQALRADVELAKSVSERAARQLEAQAISQAQLDAEQARFRSAAATLAEQQALLQKKTIRAPFAGQLGISRVNPGQYVNPGEALVTLQQLDPIHADFSLPQSELAQLRNRMSITATSDAFPGESFSGEISAINPVVDAETRNVRVQATLRNPARKLLPGMFAQLSVAAGAPQRHLTLPQNAVAFNPYGETVFVIVRRGEESAPDPNKPAALAQAEALKRQDEAQRQAAAAKSGAEPAPQPAAPPAPPAGEAVLVARQVFVKVGPTRGDQIAILSGIKEGDEVVTSGQLKLKNGTAVVVNNSVQPASDIDPRPVDQ